MTPESPRPRVCVVSFSLPPEYGGAEIAAYRYAARRYRTGGPTVLVARERGGPSCSSSDLPEFVHPVKFPDRYWTSRGRGARGTLLRLAITAWYLGRRLYALRQEFDVIHVFNAAPIFNLMALPLARILRKPVVLDLSLLGSDDPLTITMRRKRGRNGKPRRRPPIRYVLHRMADVYVTKSPALSEACRQAGLSRDRLAEIPYGVDVDRYQPASLDEKKALRAALGLHPDRLFILFVGGIHERKGLHVLLEAFRRVHSSHPASHLIVAGPVHKYDSGYVSRLHESARRWDLQGRVTFIHQVVTNVDDYMRASDIYALPSRREGLPISVLEAMSCGLAIVASDIPEIAGSQIRHGEHGLLVPVGDAEAFAGALSQLCASAEERSRLGRAARDRALREFSADSVASRYDGLYKRLLDRRLHLFEASRALREDVVKTI